MKVQIYRTCNGGTRYNFDYTLSATVHSSVARIVEVHFAVLSQFYCVVRIMKEHFAVFRVFFQCPGAFLLAPALQWNIYHSSLEWITKKHFAVFTDMYQYLATVRSHTAVSTLTL